MKTPLEALLVAVLAGTLPAQALAYTISGVIPPGRTPVVIDLRRPLPRFRVPFTFSAPRTNAGVRYALSFCLGPAANPCGMPTSHVVNVPEGQSRTTSFPTILFGTNILVVGQGTRVAVPFTVQVLN
jgi:hypothetical protein